MADFLTAVSTTTVKRKEKPEAISPDATTSQPAQAEDTEQVNLDSPEDISRALKNQPDYETLSKILAHLAAAPHQKGTFNLVTPSPITAQIADTLVVSTIPDYWSILKKDERRRKDLVTCLQNANGLGAILSRLRPLIRDARQKKSLDNTRDSSGHIEVLVDVLESCLSSDRTSAQVWNSIRTHASSETQKRLMWKEYVSQVASGRILAVVAEAEDILKERGSSRKASWLASGKDYASWLGRNHATLMKEHVGSEDSASAVTELWGKALGLGYLGTCSMLRKSNEY
jgi:telomere length regulation protein